MKEAFGMQSIAENFSAVRAEKEKTKASAAASVMSFEYVALIFCCLLAAALVVLFALIVKPLVFLPADILMWEETDFVGNIIKLNIGAPLYTDPSDGNSMIYNPAAFLVTYALAWLAGQTKSVVALRLIQIGYVICAALLATRCSQKLRRMAFPECVLRHPKTWTVFTFLAMFLAATAPNSNQFVYTLHVDALALLVSMISFWTMLRYAEDSSVKNLLVMTIFPALGFLTKQFLIGWAAVMLIFLLFQHPKNFKRLGLFIVLSGALIAAAYGVCCLLWGENYIFWAFTVMGGERKKIVFSPDSTSISLARSVNHLISLWLQIFVGIVGGWFLLRGRNFRAVGSLLVAWLALVGSEAFSSGAGWEVLYHFGPGILIGAILMFASLPQVWQEKTEQITEQTDEPPSLLLDLTRSVVLIAAVAAIFNAWNVMPSGNKDESRYLPAIQASPDIDRYIADIEREFEGLPPDKVLLGVGSWIYLRHDVLQKDRAVALADQPFGGIYQNFDVTIGRIRERTYQKILVQNLHSPNFHYEWNLWSKPSGFRDALLENYVEIREIESPKASYPISSHILNAETISVLVPR